MHTPTSLRPDPLTTPVTVVLVGGIPGAGKSTAIRRATAGRRDVQVIDSDIVRCWWRARLPVGTPYRSYRWLVHTLTIVWMAAALVRGPRTGRPLVMHDPGTRPRRRRLFLRVARSRRWRPVLVLVDVDRADAQRGQRDRRRIVRAAAFDRHWHRWRQLRADAGERSGTLDGGGWSAVRLTDRAGAADLLIALLRPPRPTPAGWLTGDTGIPSAAPADVLPGGPGTVDEFERPEWATARHGT